MCPLWIIRRYCWYTCDRALWLAHKTKRLQANQRERATTTKSPSKSEKEIMRKESESNLRDRNKNYIRFEVAIIQCERRHRQHISWMKCITFQKQQQKPRNQRKKQLPKRRRRRRRGAKWYGENTVKATIQTKPKRNKYQIVYFVTKVFFHSLFSYTNETKCFMIFSIFVFENACYNIKRNRKINKPNRQQIQSHIWQVSEIRFKQLAFRFGFFFLDSVGPLSLDLPFNK